MQISKGKLVVGISVSLGILLLIGSLLLVSVNKKNNAGPEEYYYNFQYDDNRVSQSVWVYDGKGKKQENYNLYYKGKLVTLTKADKAVLTMIKVDLKDHQELEMSFRDDLSKKYKVNYKK